MGCFPHVRLLHMTLLVIVSLMIGWQLCAQSESKIVSKSNKFSGDGTVEQIQLTAKERDDGDKTIERNGILMHYKQAKATIIICHGFMCEKDDVSFLRLLFPQGDFNFLTFDFRAHGENVADQLCTFGRDEAYDVIAAAEYIKQRPDLKDKPLLVYGFSMGAVAAIEAQSKQPLFDAMILDCPFDSSENIIKKGLENVKISLLGYEFDVPGKSILQKYAFHPYVQSFVKVLLKTVANMSTYNIQTCICPVNAAESIKNVGVPCFFIHCKNDEKVPVEAIKTIYEHAPGQKRLWLTNGGGHYRSIFHNPEKYAFLVQKFISKVIDRKTYIVPKVYEDKDDSKKGKS